MTRGPAARNFRRMIRELFHRRVPQIVGAYLAAGWLVLEFTDWAVNRYVLSSYLTDFLVAGWMLMLPGVFMVAWFHGKPGRDRWTRFEKMGLTLNLVVAAAVLFGLFRGRDLGAATTTVVVEDEEGNSIQRVIPKSEFRKRIVVFPFDNRSGNQDFEWLVHGLPQALAIDLTQDLFLSFPNDEQWMEPLREAGFESGRAVPLALKRNIAERLYVSHFVSGVITDSAGVPEVTLSLYETRRGRLLHERSYRGEDALPLVDEMSVQLKRDLELPARHVEETLDLPVAELFTTSPVAFRHYAAGEEALLEKLDYAAAAESWEAAVAEDPTFAIAWVLLFLARLELNQADRGIEALESAMDHLYRLPERLQFTIKVLYYWLVRRDAERAAATAAMWAELSPDDIDAHLAVARSQERRAQAPEAIAARQRALELDPGRVDQLLAIGLLYQSEADYEMALEYLQRYAAADPDDPDASAAIGDLYRRLGDHPAAREAYGRALVIDPNDTAARLKLARLDQDIGNFADAESGFADALEAGRTAEQRASVHDGLSSYYGFRGKMNLAISHMRRSWEELATVRPPFNLVQEQLNGLGLYGRAGRTGEGRALLDSLTSQLPEEFAVVGSIGTFSLALGGEDAEAIAEGRREFEQLIDDFGLEGARYALALADGRAAELRGDCDQAIRHYQQALELSPVSQDAKLDRAGCYRLLGRLDDARADLEDVVRLAPVHPRARHELALVEIDAGNPQGALDHLRTAMDVWQDADADYPHARRAREKLAELEGTGNLE